TIFLYYPHGMLNTVFRSEVVLRCMLLFPGGNKLIHSRYIVVCQEHYTCLGTGGFYMINPVEFLLGPGKFMFLNNTLVIVLYGRTTYQPGLLPSIHNQAVQVVAGFIILN